MPSTRKWVQWYSLCMGLVPAVLQRQVEFGLCGGLVAVERAIGGDQEFIEILAVEGIKSDAGADRKRRVLGLVAKAIGNALSDDERRLGVRLRKDENKFVSTVTSGDVNFA